MKYLVLLLLLGGCANLEFNDMEYIRYVEIQFNVQKLRDTCTKLDATKLSALKDQIHLQYLYADSMMYRSDLRESTAAIESMILPLTPTASPAYCVDKLNNVEAAVKTTMKIEALRISN